MPGTAKKVMLVAAVVLALCSAGVGALAVRNHAARRAEAAYAAQPEWIKLRDGYLASAGDDGDGGKDLRLKVVHAMLAAGESAAAEEFFFAHSQGRMGDVDCALLIARHYKTHNDAGGPRRFYGPGETALRFRYAEGKIPKMTIR